jgi:hypothetical protein
MITTPPSPQPGTAEAGTSQALELGLVHGSAPFIYFAAHAPEVPPWFKRNEWKEKVVEPTRDGRPGWVHEVVKTRMEEPMAYLVRWRMAYAAAMVAALPNNAMSHERSELAP